MFLDSIVDLLSRSDHNVDILAEGEAKIFSRARIERVGERDTQSISAQTDRERAVQTRQSAGN